MAIFYGAVENSHLLHTSETQAAKTLRVSRVVATMASLALLAVALVALHGFNSKPHSRIVLQETIDCKTFKQSPIDLLSAGAYAVLAASTITNTGPTTVNGNLGVSPGSAVTGFPPGKMVGGGVMHKADTYSAQANLDLGTAMKEAALRTTCEVILIGNLGGQTIYPGLYVSSSSMEISSGDLTIDAQGDADAIFIFKMATTFITSTGRQIFLAGGAQDKNIYWLIGSSATLGGTSVFHGTLMADQSIGLSGKASVNGRLLAKVAAVTLEYNAIVLPA